MPSPQKIAIDGPASSGKSTLGVHLAKRLGYMYFDTGLMYRAVTLAALQKLGGIDDERGVTELAEQVVIDVRSPSVNDGRREDVLLDGIDVTWKIRQPVVDANVSAVSAYPGVRVAMTEQQRRIGNRGRVVMVGRDIGTVVLPDADLKIYLEASVEERARRRLKEVQARGEPCEYLVILEALRRRDQYDSTRAVAPLRPAEDAVILNTDQLGIEEVVESAMRLVADFEAKIV